MAKCENPENPENPDFILIQTNFTNIGMAKCENPENPENPDNPDSDKFHQHWYGKI